MMIQFRTRIGFGADKDKSRYNLTQAIVSPEGVACVTNGRTAVLTRVAVIDKGHSNYAAVPYTCLPKTKRDIGQNVYCERDKVKTGPKRPVEADVSHDRFPCVHDIFPDIRHSDYVEVTFDAEQLYDLARAISRDGSGVHMLIPHKAQYGSAAAVVVPTEKNVQAVGVIQVQYPEGDDSKLHDYNMFTYEIENLKAAINANNSNAALEALNEEGEKAATT